MGRASPHRDRRTKPEPNKPRREETRRRALDALHLSLRGCFENDDSCDAWIDSDQPQELDRSLPPLAFASSGHPRLHELGASPAGIESTELEMVPSDFRGGGAGSSGGGGGIDEPLDLTMPEAVAVVPEVVPVRTGKFLSIQPVQPGEINKCLHSLAASPIFAGVDAAERNRIVPFLHTASVPAGHEVIHEGKPCWGLFLVLSGTLEAAKAEESGGERQIEKIGPGGCFGEMSLFTNDPASATVRALQDSKLVGFGREDLPRLSEALPWLGSTLARIMAQRLARTNAAEREDPRRGLVGRLELMLPSTLLQSINVNAQSGLLAVQSGRRSFTGYFHEGQLYEAASGELTGAEAVYELLGWTSGSFRFEPQSRPGAERQIHTDTIGLLIEGMKRADETRHMSTTPPPTPVSEHSTHYSTRRLALAPIPPFSLDDVDTAALALSRLPVFTGLLPEQLKPIVPGMHERRVPAGEIIVRQGQEGQALYLAASGKYEVFRTAGDGSDEPLAYLWPGDCFGEVSLFTGEPATASVRAKEGGVLLSIPREEFFRLLGRIPQVGASLAKILAHRLAKAGRRLREGKASIAGRLESMPVSELVQALHMNSQSGLLVARQGNERIEIRFLDGQILDVTTGEVSGEEVFFQLLHWSEGAFRFEPGRPKAERSIEGDTIGLLLRGLRRLERAPVTAVESAADPDATTIDSEPLA